MTSQQRFFDDLAASRGIRTSARAIIIADERVLVQQPADEPTSCYAFIGGRIELGESLEERLRKELDEELGATVASLRYLFFVENRFDHRGELIHLHEHFFAVELTGYEVASRESGLVQRWLPLRELHAYDVRPHVVRDAIVNGEHLAVRHLVV